MSMPAQGKKDEAMAEYTQGLQAMDERPNTGAWSR